MQKYYTRACNFYYNTTSKENVKKKISLPIGGNKSISFDTIEIITRTNKKKISIKSINKLPSKIKKKILIDINNISRAKKIPKLKFGNLPILMGILNITPDSFSDGGKFNKKVSAKKQIDKLIADGAKIIDVGGESTRPGSKEIPQTEEWLRVNKVMSYLKSKKLFVSLDTRKSFVMKKASKYKLDLINDVSGLSHDSEAINFLKNSKLPFVIHHMKGTTETMQKNPNYNNVLLDIYDYFEDKLKLIKKNGIKHNHIILDPGIGFGKNMKHNITLINNISIFHSLGLPVMLGISRKRFIKDISGQNDSEQRIGGTVSSSIFGMLQGIQILRIHDVNEVNQGIKVFKKLNFS
ncbi:dihydropteroate synthase [Pelagibacterales bacterium SAG-MED17]|nr:dihydropteroate synthase [Pelagibacterales bacterium SAG-MED17]